MTRINIQFTLFSAFYSPLISTMSGGFLAAEGLEPHWFNPPSYSAFTNGKHYGRGDIFVANETHLR